MRSDEDSGRSLLHLADIDVDFDASDGSRVEALRHVELSIDQHEFVTLVGASGCGKSTLLKVIAGLLKPSSGRMHQAGDKADLSIGFVFQDPVLMPWRSALENVLFPLQVTKTLDERTRARARALLALVGLDGFEKKMPYELSGGMQQRVAIARALVHNPDLLLMDEPFAALDAMTREELGFELLRIWAEFRKTVVFVTHSITEAVVLADRCVVMSPRPGRIVETIAIDLPRPRTIDTQFSDGFKDLSHRVRSLIYARSDAPTRGRRTPAGEALAPGVI